MRSKFDILKITLALTIGVIIAWPIPTTVQSGKGKRNEIAARTINVSKNYVSFSKGTQVGRLSRHLKVVSFGDSITKGKTADVNGNPIVGVSYVRYVFQYEKVFTDLGVSGSGVLPIPAGNNIIYQNLGYQISKHPNLIKSANIITIAYGTNEYRYLSGKLQKQAVKVLDQDLTHIQALNPNARLIAMLPLERWVTKKHIPALKTHYRISKHHGYSLNTISNNYRQVYQKHGVEILDWNALTNKILVRYNQTIDGTHPTQQTYNKLGIYFGRWLTGLE
ncbi:SGNH/GDSL hydrolase family protein [Periweissella beninensis]|uniref:SGNH/GDSL hydrolase family protein n=1 Tax=Periweissella beninensis TaxID=504936 RepID=A0ABT0VJZ7_9LACO|nr:SGNH/GDSL hydrolase family protein [Periweissella beninensis]MBM7544174.1 hypothetical protein [Periweissella beninensis]MCM2437453.1 SGNH/GDSL hydrolase family protein [Periweissella beninensis]MCT4396680.1 SGNH/GDSL hydrolase family protein [Periweissella beninensis]